MKIQIPKVVKRLELGEYDPAYASQFLEVWVNPTRELLFEREQYRLAYDAANKELAKLMEQKEEIDEAQIKNLQERLKQIGAQFDGWFSIIWSQGSEESKVNPDEVREFLEMANKQDPQLNAFVFDRTIAMIGKYRTERKN